MIRRGVIEYGERAENDEDTQVCFSSVPYLQAEDRAMLGSNSSADLEVKTEERAASAARAFLIPRD